MAICLSEQPSGRSGVPAAGIAPLRTGFQTCAREVMTVAESRGQRGQRRAGMAE